MDIVTDWLRPNQYLRSLTPTLFISNLLHVINRHFPDSLLGQKAILSGVAKYPGYWPKDLDLFKFIKPQFVKLLQEKDCYLVFDSSMEGFSPIDNNWFDILYYNCENYKIAPSQIIFTSSNLKDEHTLEKYCKEQHKQPLNVISFPFFESYAVVGGLPEVIPMGIPDQELSKVKQFTNESFQGKYFSSLSRVKRQHRNISQFLLCQDDVKQHALVSQNRLNEDELLHVTTKTGYNRNLVNEWNNYLPLTIDQTDFNINWAADKNFSPIHNQTIFQLVNETFIDSFSNTSMFYSEKTFRPVMCFQPFIIFGQPGCNHYLKNIGYELYDDWFDLSFDWEEDYVERFLKILKVLQDTCAMLNSMTIEEQISWKFKNKEVLIHNYQTMKEHTYTKEKFKNFALGLEQQINNSRLF